MSLVCINGSRECCGCTLCQTFSEPEERACERSGEVNKNRRKRLENLVAGLREIYSQLEDILFEEQSILDNIPENLQGSEKYEMMEQAVSNMEEALEKLDEATDLLEDASA